MRARGVLWLAVALTAWSGAPHAAESGAEPGQTSDPSQVHAFANEIAAKKQRLVQLNQDLSERQKRVRALGRRYVRGQRVSGLALASDVSHLFAQVDRESRVRRQLLSDIQGGAELELERLRLHAELARAGDDAARLSSQAALWTQDGGEARRGEAFEQAFSAPVSFQAVGDSSASSPFARARGHLLLPVASNEPGRLVHREGAEGPGMEFRAPRGAQIRAVFAGRVAFSDRFGPYGRMVIVDHGDHYYSVYGDLGQVRVKVGDELAAGAPLGSLSDEGRGVAYVEVRHRTETVEPGPWFGL